jgi:hypothetical protein
MRYLLLAFILCSCGPSFYLKKAERAIKKAEQLGAKVSRDTVWNTMEIPVPEVRIDTLVQNVDFRDTIFVSNDRIVTKVKVNTVLKSVFVESDCLPDTVTVKVPVIVKQVIKAGATTWDLIILAIVCLVVGFIAGMIYKRR